ncbi:WD40 repeat protein/energy-coupling factor transporter ATP-binding protein EcfA2 [Saccharothrix ecbatanensis]|uniref:WD40 repeat protein/energy-coupling factor transporter ATP-binding protein EcfA2 n=1 Tax=Saccharothrix ecbatanensis TaxID=1105145 RepID=A0A7W9HPR2_9PSEU|nr:trypsin-like peptidase domain-containing protein [Saccharothrix ecbatanensis]MBB5805911.1 WD40 repeat protein/energy-coupling factor transporter ATP-binding protein EcfA2 [Saccharothrix ecbatanensis]
MVERALVRVFRDREPIGVGFLVSEDMILTCAHVIGDEDEVEVDFPVLGETVRARVVHRPEGVDAIGLRLDRTPTRARAVRVVAEDDIRDHRVRTFGVPDRRPDGVWSQGVVRGVIAGGRIHIEDDRTHGLPMLQGFSGGPVIDDDLGAVVGMVVEVEARREHRIGYALSGAALHDAWPELAAITNQPSPFRGLEPFQPGDAEYFFGRAERARELKERLDRDGVLVVTGPSGCGKSSLVLAGLVPALPEVVIVRPATGSSPWAALATALGAEDITADRVEDAVNRLIIRKDLRRLTLVVDQFDEALTRFPDESADLLDALLDTAASHHHTPRVDVVVTSTTEPLNRLLADPKFGSRLAGHTATLGAPSAAELREAVEGPLAEPGMPVLQKGLADAVLEDLQNERNPLPLLEFTLTLLWERQDRGVLTHDAYRELGGVAGAVSTYAEQVWQRFDPDEVRRVLTQLVSPLDDGRFVRRAVRSDQLGGIALDLARTRLVTLGPSTVELVHECLVRHWDRLRGWVEEDREFRLWQDEVDRQAARWQDTGERALLIRGKALRRAKTVYQERRDDLTDRQRRFLEASNNGYYRRIAVRACAVSLVFSLTVSTIYAVSRFIGQQGDADADRVVETLLDRARSAYAAPELITTTALAFRTVDNVNTRQALRGLARSLRHAEVVIPGASLPNLTGTRIAEYGDRGELVGLWDVTTSPAKRVDVEDGGHDVIWLTEDRIADHGPSGDVHIRDARTGQVVHTVEARADVMAADSTGRWLAHATLGATEVHVVDLDQDVTWTVASPAEVQGDRQRPPGTATLSDVLAGGEPVVDVDDKRLALSPVGSREVPSVYPNKAITRAEPVTVQCVGEELVMQRLPDKAALESVNPGAGECVSGTFSPDGTAFAVIKRPSSGVDQLWLGSPKSRTGITVPKSAWVHSVAVEDSGAYRVVLTYGPQSLVLRVPPPDGLDQALRGAERVEITPDGAHAVLFRQSGRVEVWRTADRSRAAGVSAGRWHPDDSVRTSYALSPDSKTLATRDGDSPVVKLWNLPDLAPLGDLTAPGSDREHGHTTLQFLEADRLLTHRVDRLGVWEARTGKPVGEPIALTDGMTPFTAPVGEDEVVIVTGDLRVRRYSLIDGREVPGSEFSYGDPTSSSANRVATDEDGELVALYADNAVQVYDLETGELEDRLDVPDKLSVSRLRFRADPDDVEVTIGDPHASGGQVLLWSRNLMWGLPALLGRPDMSSERLPGPAAPGFADAGGLESADPAVWLGEVCDVARRSGLTLEADRPSGSFEGAIC